MLYLCTYWGHTMSCDPNLFEVSCITRQSSPYIHMHMGICDCPVWHANLQQYISDGIAMIEKDTLMFFPGRFLSVICYEHLFRWSSSNLPRPLPSSFGHFAWYILQLLFILCSRFKYYLPYHPTHPSQHHPFI